MHNAGLGVSSSLDRSGKSKRGIDIRGSLEIVESTIESVWTPELALKVSDEMTLGVVRTLHQESDPISLTLSRHSVTRAALSPVIFRI